MSAQGARVIDLEEYRRRREAQSQRPAPMRAPLGMTSAAPVPIVWFPVWAWVPYWPML